MSSTTAVPLLSSTYSDASGADKPKKIHDAAQQFEALMINEMLKSAHGSDSDGWLGGGESTGDDSAMDMAESQLSKAMATNGGIGLAGVIERMMTRQTNGPQNTAQTPEPASTGSSNIP